MIITFDVMGKDGGVAVDRRFLSVPGSQL